jgi:PAS domain S-box-containing protein
MTGIDYRAIFESVDNALLVVDADSGRVLDVNQQCCSMLGRTASALEDLSLSDLLADTDTVPSTFTVGANRDEGSEPAVGQHTIDVGGGETHAAEVRFSALDDDSVLVTIRKLVGSGGATQPQRGGSVLTQLVEHTPDVMWMFSADWDEYVYVNGAYEEVFGRSLSTLRENPTDFLKGTHPEDRDRVVAAIERLSEGESVDIEYRVDPTIDFQRHVWVQGTPIRNESGEVYRVAGFVREVTERRERKLELLRQRNLVENVPIGVFRVALDDQQLTQVNPALVSMLDAEDETDLLGRDVATFFVDDDSAPQLVEDLREQETVTFETRFETVADRVFWGRLTAVLQTGDEGQSVVDGVVEDISARKHRQRQLRVVDRILRHNMRNDISVISGYASYLAENGADIDEAVESILTRSQKLLRTAEKGHVVVDVLSEAAETTSFDLIPDIDRTVEGLEDLFPDATIDVALPQEAHVDALRDVDLAVHELIENSIVHHDGTPTIAVDVRTGDDTVTIRVSDDGPGIPSREYEILSGVRDVDSLSHGSGMGLWLVHWIVRLSGGEIDFDTSSDGSVVTITLPKGAEDVRGTPVDARPGEDR